MWKRMWKRASRWLASMRKQHRPDNLLEGQIDPDETQDMPELRIEKTPEPTAEEPIELDSPVKPEAPTAGSLSLPATAPPQEPALDPLPEPESLSLLGTPDNPMPFPRNDAGEFDSDAIIPGVSYHTPSSPSSQPQQTEQVDFYTRPSPPDGTTVPTSGDIDRIMASSEDDSLPPSTNKVRIPPEFAGQQFDSPLPPGLEFASPGTQQGPTQQTESSSPNDKPATEQQGDQLIQLITEQTRVLEGIRDSFADMATAIDNLASALENHGSVV
jgi:hypothetical protein